MSFSQSIDHYLRFASDHMPAVPVYAAGFTIPFWVPSLAQISAFAAQVTPVLVMLATLVKVYGAVREWVEKRREAGKPLVPGGKIILGVAAAVGILAAFAWLTATPSKAAPAVAAVPAAAAASKRKRPADDDDEDTTDVAGKSRLYAVVLADLGLREALPNGKPNPDVKAMFAAVKGFNPKTVDCTRVPWCSAGMNWWAKKAGAPGTNSAMARSWLYWGKATDDPKPGDVVVFWRGKYDDGQTGHVAVFERFDGNYVVHIGGNQSDAVTRTRTHKSRVLQYRRHMALWESRQMHGAALQAAGSSGAAGTAATDTDAPAQSGTELAKEAIDSVREPVTQVSDYLPHKWQTYAYLLCTVLLLAGTAIVVYERMKYRKNIGW